MAHIKIDLPTYQMLVQTQKKVDKRILNTPTGELREELTDINILLLILKTKIEKEGQ